MKPSLKERFREVDTIPTPWEEGPGVATRQTRPTRGGRGRVLIVATAAAAAAIALAVVVITREPAPQGDASWLVNAQASCVRAVLATSAREPLVPVRGRDHRCAGTSRPRKPGSGSDHDDGDIRRRALVLGRFGSGDDPSDVRRWLLQRDTSTAPSALGSSCRVTRTSYGPAVSPSRSPIRVERTSRARPPRGQTDETAIVGSAPRGGLDLRSARNRRRHETAAR